MFLLNIISLNFVPTLNKFLRFTRLKKSYVNRVAVGLIKVALFLFIQTYTANVRNLFLLNTPVAQMLLNPRWVIRRKDGKQLSINLELSFPSAAE